ncbi:hypothetical protein [Faecalispora sporosphaeroides]|uniref:Uncharacterized protein n=1 Tax=Faecalispora sporosphaeroides TaxID=1549 RepID=A0A928Q4V2_9FIRM|nr:hypothetical protein [Faecalispora sporosphaeroides]MBE6834361.1 hypothetical protein [Faecalispora sporosphaeroides]
MERKLTYTAVDCSATGLGYSIQGKVVVINHDNPERQLYFCLCGNGAGANPSGSAAFLVSLCTGEFALKNRSEIIGILKPELLPDSAKLQLSQIRPVGALNFKNHEPKYSGYSFLPDGRYASGVWLCTEQEALNYVEMQKPYQHRIMLCDRDDFCVLEMKNGRLLHPSQEEMEALQNPENGGLTMT